MGEIMRACLSCGSNSDGNRKQKGPDQPGQLKIAPAQEGPQATGRHVIIVTTIYAGSKAGWAGRGHLGGSGWLDRVGFGWTGLDQDAGQGRMRVGSGSESRIEPPGVVLPVNPSTLLVWKHLQKFDPSGTRQEAVSEPSGLCSRLFPQGCSASFASNRSSPGKRTERRIVDVASGKEKT